MGVTDFLKREHEIVLRVLGEADDEVAAMTATGTVDVATLRGILSFLRGFLASSHQLKEELRLFPLVERTGMPVFDIPLAMLRREHDEGRERIRCLEAALEAAPEELEPAAIGSDLRVYGSLLRRHMAREEELFFPLAEVSLTPMEQSELEREFREMDETGPGVGECERDALPARGLPEMATPPSVPSSPPPEASR